MKPGFHVKKTKIILSKSQQITPSKQQHSIWTNAEMFWIDIMEIKSVEILIKIHMTYFDWIKYINNGGHFVQACLH